MRYILGLVLAAAFSMPGQAANKNEEIFGQWRVVAALDSADVTILDNRQAKRLVGKHAKISKDSFEFDGRICRTPTYEQSQEKTAIYFRQNMNASTENLHLPDTVTAIDARCTFLFPKPGGKLMFLWKGFFFDAVRVVK